MIKIGYVIGGSGEQVNLKEHHTIVSGMTGESGKTTAIEGIVKNWDDGQSFLLFQTKRGEIVFENAEQVRPFFKTPSGEGLWLYVESMVQITMQEKDRSLRPVIIKVCQNAQTLDDVWNNVKHLLKKARGWEEGKLIELNEYLKLVLPEIAKYNFSDKLPLESGKRYVMDLKTFSVELQSMIIGACAIEILNHHKQVTLVIPEAWEILPNGRGSPAKLAVESLVRKGRVMKNFVVLDSQDIAGIHFPLRKNVSNWLLGKQSDPNEAERTIDTLPLPKSQKPQASEIQTLRLGQFYTVIDGKVNKVFVQPAWMDDEDAQRCAREPEYAYEMKQGHERVSIITEPWQVLPKAEEPLRLGELPELQPLEPEPIGESMPESEAFLSPPNDITNLYNAIQAIVRDVVKTELGAGLNIDNGKRHSSTIQTEQAEITVIKKQVTMPDIDESTLEGKLLLLAAEGFFDEGKSPTDIFETLTNRWKIDMTQESFIKHGVAGKNLERWILRPYEYIKKDGRAYIRTELGKKYLHLKRETVAT